MSIRKIFSVPLDMKEPTSTRQFRVNEGDSGNVIIITLTIYSLNFYYLK